jgi:hypothetical protein
MLVRNRDVLTDGGFERPDTRVLGNDTYVLDLDHFLITSLDLPIVVQIVKASEEQNQAVEWRLLRSRCGWSPSFNG